MTDKQIIIDKNKFEKAENEPINQEAVNKFIEETDKFYIDGVDVSGCEYWKGYCRIASLCDHAGHLCEVNPNCYYKQLKRKEQEHKEAQKALAKCWIENGRTKKECEELKEQCKKYGEINEQETKDYAELKATIEDLLSIQYKLADNNKQLRQALAEIKEIAEEIYNDEQIKFQASGVCYEILQKIKEVEDDKSNN